MKYKIVNLNTSTDKNPKSSVLIIYTGGTFGMAVDESGALAPFNFSLVVDKIPELKAFDLRITVISFPAPEDSSNINSKHWIDIGYIIHENYSQYDGFVVLHGTDTMAYSASALSYMLEGLSKPVIFTGAQIPIGFLRSDARENLITALEIASAKIDDKPIINEVCVYFNFFLLRGNRSQKLHSSTFAAFESDNYPKLAESGVFIEYNHAYIRKHVEGATLKLHSKFDNNVAVIKLYPGISRSVLEQIFATPGLKAVLLETFGSGNTMKHDWFLEILRKANSDGIILYNVSQCVGGKVIQGRYETSKLLSDIGVLSGADITTEAAITKLMFLLGTESSTERVKDLLIRPIRGEMT